MIKTVLIDDNIDELNHLSLLCEKINFVHIEKTFTSSIEAFTWLNENSIDLIISDVEMPEINGIKMIENLKQIPEIIFASAYPNYALDSFSVAPLHFLTKPIKMETLLIAVHRAKEKINKMPAQSDYIFVLNNKEYQKVILDHILFVKAEENFVSIHLEKETMMVLSNLTQFTKQLPGNKFIRVHKSWSVHLNAVEKYTSEHVIVQNTIIPIGNAYKNVVLSILKEFSIQRKGEE